MDNNNGYVKQNIENGIATITFFHPSSNSLPGAILEQLAHTITDTGNNTEVKVIVLKSDGERAFCAGASFDELVAINDEVSGKKFFSGFANVINAMRTVPQLVIARVQGKAVGGGVGIAAAADYTMATKFASVKLSELAVGIGPFVVGPAVERKIGTSAFAELSIDAASWRDAQWAMTKGLYASVHEDINALDEAVAALASTLSNSNPEAMAFLKSIFWENAQHWDTLLNDRATISGKLVLSEFTRNAIAKFKNG